VEKYGRTRQATDENIIQRMRFACWITKATDTHSEYVILVAFPRQQRLRERVSILHYRYITCLVFFFLAHQYKYHVRIFSRSALARGPEKHFSPRPVPAPGFTRLTTPGAHSAYLYAATTGNATKRSPERPPRRWEDIKMHLKELGYDSARLIHSDQERCQWSGGSCEQNNVPSGY
jgi:hypothetical protein